jgi:group I intron endonuclease
MYICNSLLKHGHLNFSLTILEYCEPEKCLEREKHYWGLLNPEYNIAKDPTAPMSGRKHSEKTKQIMSETENSGRFKPGHKHLDEARKKMSEAKLGKPRPEVAGRPYQAIEVFDIKNNLTTQYESISAAAIALDIKQSIISTYFVRNQQKPFKGRYLFRK